MQEEKIELERSEEVRNIIGIIPGKVPVVFSVLYLLFAIVVGVKNRHYQTKQEVSSQYKFVIAFENAIEAEWITEKFFDPLLVGSVPVYLGAPNVEEYAPGNNCFIHANRMSAAELAEVLVEYLNNENLYNQLLDWKNEGLASGFLKKMEVVREHFVLRLLNKLKEKGWWT